MLKLSAFDVNALRFLARGLEADPARMAGRKLLGRFTDPSSAGTRLWARLMSGDNQLYTINHLLKHSPTNKPAIDAALSELGQTSMAREGLAKRVGIGAGAGVAAGAGAHFLGRPIGQDEERRNIGQTVEYGLPSMPLSQRLGTALKTVFTPSAMGQDINSALNQ